MNDRVIKILSGGGVGVLLTDTLYGIVGRALDKKVVERIYRMKDRNSKKPLIVLISSVNDLKLFGIAVDEDLRKKLNKLWPGAVSIILPCKLMKFEYIHRGTKSIAFRLPKKQSLIKILKRTGPLVAPSANPEGAPPAKNLKEAKEYFGDGADFYRGGGTPRKTPSTIVRMSGANLEIIRK